MSNKVQELINMGQDIENAEIELKEAKGLLGKQKAQSKVYQAINKFKGAVLSVEDVKENKMFESFRNSLSLIKK